MTNRLVGNCTQRNLRKLLDIYEEKAREIKRTTFLKRVSLSEINEGISSLGYGGDPNYTKKFFLDDYALRTYSFKNKEKLYYVLVWSSNDILWEIG